MLIDKRSILKEAEARNAAARTLQAAEEKRKQAEEKVARSAACKLEKKLNLEKGETEMTKEKATKKSVDVEKAAQAAKETAEKTAEAVGQAASKAVKAAEKNPVASAAVKKAEKAAEKAADKAVREAKPAVKKAAKSATEKSRKAADTVKKTVRKAVAKKPEETVYIQFEGKEIDMKELTDAAVKAYQEAHKGAEIKSVEIYVKPEESAAYYVVNGDAAPEYRIDL